MDLNSLKEKTKQFKAPEDYLLISKEKEESMNSFIQTLKFEEEKEAKKIKSTIIFFIIAAILFGISFLFSMLGVNSTNSSGTGYFSSLLSLVFLLVVILSHKKINQLKRISYNEPIKTFLEKAEKRYQFYGMESWFISIIGCLILYLGAIVYVVPYLETVFSTASSTTAFFLFTVFYFAVCLAGFYFTYKDWEKEKKSFWLTIKKMKSELDYHKEN